MAERLLAFARNDYPIEVHSTQRTRSGRVVVFALLATAAAAVMAYAYYRYNQGPYFVPYDPTDPQYDVYGRPIHHQIQPPPVGENETTMQERGNGRRSAGYDRWNAPSQEQQLDNLLRDEDPLAYYHKHYAGLTRHQLQVKDRFLYEKLRRLGLLDQIPLVPTHSSEFETPADRAFRLKDPLGYYHTHYEGVSRGKLRYVNHALYSQLVRLKLIDQVPLQNSSR